uniref:Uncharacterized protein n=1 Tax=Calcidiscus leptoporus TaxID=127549 RepID=A0A7S0IYC6_9EUKA|mmetsp:Transcript_29009/g.67931  ORF Transcript_29009/g.67931 Transcript_29009/m.67931 type:complete len:130 (+) Transcript_29009:53-442(+)|eukprot:CAMPEP_0119366106 /NCGR_PEP_ID=MMETSP1334-20130426/12980_1 /TAXON_ID=127549 /ORGANISM="Calcidiscus leptoporus, Strain RCC1130" /LENGTH=129 /DNA_ID=CAMNT_0007382227 /DNA_START=49 /DNA_END=438 /DNA_ORIENTATION=-
MLGEEVKPSMPALAKCTLAASFLLALGIWFVVSDPFVNAPDPHAAGLMPAKSHRTPRHTAVAARAHGEGMRDSSLAHEGMRGSGNGSRRRRPRGVPREVAGESTIDVAQSRIIQNASSDPTSMFDMSTP